MTQQATHSKRRFQIGAALAVAALVVHVVAAQTADSVAGANAPKHYRGGQPRANGSRSTALADRVRLMSKELDLDTSQQQQLTAILIAQRGEVARAWSDPTVPAALRISATQRISESTGDRIRAILTDGQREKYIKVHPRDTPVGAPGADLDKWMAPAAARDAH